MKSTIQQSAVASIFFVWVLSNSLFSQGLKISSGGYLRTYGSPYILVKDGNVTNNGTWSCSGTGLTTFSGTKAVLLSGYGATSMYDVLLSNSGGVLQQIRQMDMHNLSITASSKITIDTAKSVIVANVIDNQAGVGGIYLKSSSEKPNASLVFHNSYSSPVNASVEMYTKAYKETTYKWQFFGIPVRSVVASPTFDGSYVRKFNESGWNVGYTDANLWISLVNTSILKSFSGYEITQSSPRKIYFSGQLENSDFSSGQLSYTSGAQYPGQHLIGNPYTAAIDIKKIQFGSSEPAIMDNVVYIYNTGSIDDWQGGGRGTIHGVSPGQYISIPQNQAGSGGIPAQIPSMQAFLVKVHSVSPAATITIPYSAVGTVVRNTEMQHIKKLDAYKEDDKVLTIIDVCGIRYSDRTWLFTQDGCTHGYDNGWDGIKALGSSLIPQVWTIENQDNYQINSFNDIDSTVIGFKKGEDSIYTLTVSHYNTESQYPRLYMADLQTGILTDVSANGTSLTFKSVSNSDDYARFMLLRPKGETPGEYMPTKESRMDIVAVRKYIYVVNNTDEELVFGAININGKVLSQERISKKGLSKLNYELPDGTYIGRLSSRSASVLRKLVIR